MNPLLELLYEALHSAVGVVVECGESDRHSVRQKLYAQRREAGDEALATLSILDSPTVPTQLWIVRRTKEQPNAEE